MGRTKQDGVTATVSINGKELGNLDDLVRQPTQEFRDAFRGLAERAMGYVEPQPAVIPATQLGFDYSLIDEGIRDEVKEAARSIRQLERGVVTGICAIGKRLIEVKGMIPHGQFCGWCVGEFGLEPRMAQNMMNVAREFDDPQKRNTVSFFSPSTLYILAAPSTPEMVRVMVLEQAQATGVAPTRAQVKRLRDEQRPKPTPPPAKVVYVEPTAQRPSDDVLHARQDQLLDAIVDKIAALPQPDPDEAEAIALVEAETAQEDAERAARDAQRPSFERVPEPEPVAAPASDALERLKRASLLRYMLIQARDAARRDYGDLTGRHTDMLEFERGVADMLPPLESLIAILEGTK